MEKCKIDPLVVGAVEHGLGTTRSEIQINKRLPLGYQSNTLYDVYFGDRHLIAKHFLKPDELTVAPAREYGALQRLAPYDIAPQPIFYDPAIGPIVLYEFLPGIMWDRQCPSATQLDRLARLWLALHALPTADLWPSRGWEKRPEELFATFQHGFDAYDDWAAVHFPKGQTALVLCREALERVEPLFARLFDMQAPLCFCRSDPRFANVIERADGRLAYVDWEDSGLRDPARDLADLLTHPNQEDLLDYNGWQPFLQSYLAERTAIDPTVAERTHYYLAIFPLFWLSVCFRIGIRLAQSGQLGSWQINGLPANVRLQRYLDRALAWPQLDPGDILSNTEGLLFFPTMD